MQLSEQLQKSQRMQPGGSGPSNPRAANFDEWERETGVS